MSIFFQEILWAVAGGVALILAGGFIVARVTHPIPGLTGIVMVIWGFIFLVVSFVRLCMYLLGAL